MTVRFARAHCPKPDCRALTEAAVEDDQTHMECKGCGQKNGIQERSSPLTGRCAFCNKPIDDHHTGGRCP